MDWSVFTCPRRDWPIAGPSAAEGRRCEGGTAPGAEVLGPGGEGARGLLAVGLGARKDEGALYGRVGGALPARLLVSGETKRVVDVSGLGLNGEEAARIG